MNARPTTAEVLYGSSSAPREGAVSAPLAPARKVTADVLYPSVAPPEQESATQEQAPAEEVRQPAEQVLFGDPEVLAKTYESSISSALDQFEQTPAERSELLRDSAVLFNELGMPPGEASGFMSMFAAAMGESEITDAQIDAWNASLPADLISRYGQADYQARLRKVRAFTKSVPGLNDSLQVSGLGSHPKVVGALMERAHSLRPRKSK
jgi:hypothetical protein